MRNKSVNRIAEILAQASAKLGGKGVPNARFDCEYMLARLLGLKRADLYSAEIELTEDIVRKFEESLSRRLRREPLAYILGDWEFYGRTFQVNPDVLIPRPETEYMVELAAERINFMSVGTTSIDVLDLCTGSGNIAITLALECPDARVTAADISPAALKVAQANAEDNGLDGRIRWLESDLFGQTDDKLFDFIISNPPYVAATDMIGLQPELDYEPTLALSGGADGVEIIRKILAQAPDCLKAGGEILLETAETHGEILFGELSSCAHWKDVRILSDLNKRNRYIHCRRSDVHSKRSAA